MKTRLRCTNATMLSFSEVPHDGQRIDPFRWLQPEQTVQKPSLEPALP
ncbi:hypothetical protein P879_11888 [Paragonimus westermani]|uniref:Uncharacterized protein n=1 Tax=Paragonimus westermani TaxID=34504 RepID=A0A8T0D7V0_9TREM|nr:hypothetical protein P879_11888 [Paragonimus westermani]